MYLIHHLHSPTESTHTQALNKVLLGNQLNSIWVEVSMNIFPTYHGKIRESRAIAITPVQLICFPLLTTYAHFEFKPLTSSERSVFSVFTINEQRDFKNIDKLLSPGRSTDASSDQILADF